MDVDAKPKQTKAATGPKAQPKKEPMTPEEKARMEARIRAKVACDKAAYDVQMLLIEPGISDEALKCAAEVLQPHHYNDIVEERALDGLCGFPSCSAVAPAKGQGKKLHISLSAHKVYDISTLHNFCGRECAAHSRRYAETLQSTSLFLRTGSSDAAVKAVAAVKAAIAGAPAAAEAAASIAAMDISDAAASASDATTAAAAATTAAMPATTAAMPPPLAPCPDHPAPATATPSADCPAAPPFGAGHTFGDVVERPSREAPNLAFPSPASFGTIEGYQGAFSSRGATTAAEDGGTQQRRAIATAKALSGSRPPAAFAYGDTSTSSRAAADGGAGGSGSRNATVKGTVAQSAASPAAYQAN